MFQNTFFTIYQTTILIICVIYTAILLLIIPLKEDILMLIYFFKMCSCNFKSILFLGTKLKIIIYRLNLDLFQSCLKKP